MSLWSDNCRLIQRAGDRPFLVGGVISQSVEASGLAKPRDTGLPIATPSLRFLGSRICWKAGAVSRARVFCAAKRTLDTTPAFHRMSMESEEIGRASRREREDAAN